MKTIVARITVEVLGSPKEHVEETLIQVLKKLKEEKNITIKEEKAYECAQMDNKLWSTFADVKFETTTLRRVQDICFDYMPSTLEILEPLKLEEVDCNEFSDLMNDMLTQLHKYMMVVNKLKLENTYMMKELEKIKGKK